MQRGGVSSEEESDHEGRSSRNCPKSKVSLPVHMHQGFILDFSRGGGWGKRNSCQAKGARTIVILKMLFISKGYHRAQ